MLIGSAYIIFTISALIYSSLSNDETRESVSKKLYCVAVIYACLLLLGLSLVLPATFLMLIIEFS